MRLSTTRGAGDRAYDSSRNKKHLTQKRMPTNSSRLEGVTKVGNAGTCRPCLGFRFGYRSVAAASGLIESA